MWKDALRCMRASLVTLVMLAAGGALSGCRAKVGGDCTRTECDEGLSCYEWVCRPKAEAESLRADQERGKLCRATCRFDGLCGAKNGKCIAVDQADCRKSMACEQSGACSLQDGACAVISDEDCKLGRSCTRDGKCHVSKGTCTLAPGACRERAECKEHGLCTEQGGACVAKADADCEASLECRRFAECTAQGGKCVVADDDDCARSSWCAQFANCKLGEGPGGCVRDAKQFPDSQACPRYGCCGKGPGNRCQPRSDADCKKSAICVKDGECFVRMGACVRSCKDTPDCRSHGLCTDGPGTTCIAGSDEECASSLGCKDSAQCTAEGGKCVVTDASCAAHKHCSEHSHCWAKNGKCVATEEACRKHEQCRKYGWCGLVDGWCKATTLEHCKQSEMCSTGAPCRLVKGLCER